MKSFVQKFKSYTSEVHKVEKDDIISLDPLGLGGLEGPILQSPSQLA